MIGQTLGAYTVQRELGRGGMGAVYVGVHGLLGRTAAIKVLLPEMSRNQEVVQRFFNEARAATAIRHAGIVEVYDFGWSSDGNAYIVMEFLDGESLSTRLRRLGRLPPTFALGVARQTALALAAAHKVGIVHRDLKPDNVFLVPDVETSIGERVKLLDFGIAKLAGDTADPSHARTTTGAILGTPYYMSPEQCKGAAQVDHRSDLYSLGCMLHQMCCGTVPFLGEGAGDIIGKHIYVAPTPLRQIASDVPAEIEAYVLRLLAKAPGDRPASADAVGQELGQLVARLGTAQPVSPMQLANTLPASTPQPIVPTVPVVPTPPGMTPPTAGASTALSLPPDTSPKPITTLSAAATEAPVTSRPKRSGLFIGLGGAALVGVIAVVAIVASGGKNTTTTANNTPNDGATAVVHDAAVPTPKPVSAELQAALAQGRQSLSDERWVDADAAAQAALKIDPNNPDAKQLSETAAREQAAELKFSDFHNALQKGDLEGGARAYAQIAPASLYKQRAHDIGLGEINKRAEKLAMAGKCKELEGLAKHLGSSWSEAAESVLAFPCKGGHAGGTTAGGATAGGTDVAAASAVQSKFMAAKRDYAMFKQTYGNRLEADWNDLISFVQYHPNDPQLDEKIAAFRRKMTAEVTTNAVATGTTNEGVQGTAASADDLATKAKEAYSRGQYTAALTNAEQALAIDRGNTAMLNIAAISACNVKNAAKARKYIALLPSNKQPTARAACQRNGVDVSAPKD